MADQAADLVRSGWMSTLLLRGRPFGRVAAGRAMVGRNRSRTDPTAGRFTHGEVAGFIDSAFDHFERQVPGLPSEPTAGSRQNVMLAALTLSLLEALEQAGVERAYAIELAIPAAVTFASTPCMFPVRTQSSGRLTSTDGQSVALASE